MIKRIVGYFYANKNYHKGRFMRTSATPKRMILGLLVGLLISGCAANINSASKTSSPSKTSNLSNTKSAVNTSSASNINRSSIIKYKGHEYKFVYQAVSWHEAKKLAGQAGGYLAVFETPEELLFVKSAQSQRKTAWVGLTDSKKEGEWRWINGEKLDPVMSGYLQMSKDLQTRDYAHILLQGSLMSRDKTGIIPKGWPGRKYVEGYVIEWDSPKKKTNKQIHFSASTTAPSSAKTVRKRNNSRNNSRNKNVVKTINNERWGVIESPSTITYVLETLYGTAHKNQRLSLTVVQRKSKLKPNIIYFELPDSVIGHKGLYINFCNTERYNNNTACGKDLSFIVRFSDCEKNTCKAHVDDILLKSNNHTKEMDILELLTSHNTLDYSFFDKTGYKDDKADLSGFHRTYKHYKRTKNNKKHN